MKVLPVDPLANATPEALLAFFHQCRDIARARGRAQLVSISVTAEALDPLAVLESIFEEKEKHFYVEKPSEHFAVAGAEAVVELRVEGPERFERAQSFVDETLENTLAVGATNEAFGGPLFFAAFAFSDDAEPGSVFPPLQLFVPRWQVGCRDGGTVVTANVLVEPQSPVEGIAERVWRARQKFAGFDYAEPNFAEQPRPSCIIEETGGEGHYEAAVQRALALIEYGAFQKIVLARAQDLRCPVAFHPLRSLNGLRERFTECYAFSVANGLGQSFIGASPERLLRVRGGTVLTEALAGSIRRGTSASEDAALGAQLLREEKDLREQRTVLDTICRNLEALGLKPRHSERPMLKKLANVQHLHTPVEAPLPEDVRLLSVLSKLHPTPAVGGAPKEKALPQIRPLEGFPRGLYAGAIGWVDCRGDGEFFVGLRSALIDGSRTRLFAGAGIVAGSNPAKEHAETELKFRAMREALL